MEYVVFLLGVLCFLCLCALAIYLAFSGIRNLKNAWRLIFRQREPWMKIFLSEGLFGFLFLVVGVGSFAFVWYPLLHAFFTD